MPWAMKRERPVRKRPLKPHEIFDPAIHSDRRSGLERRKPWQRTDPNDRRSGQDRRKPRRGIKAAHVFEIRE